MTLTELVHPGHLDLGQAIDRLSAAPARILGLAGQGAVREGSPANLVVFDPDMEWTVDPMRFRSKSRNTPFAGRVVKGKVLHTFFNGKRTVADGRVLAEARV